MNHLRAIFSLEFRRVFRKRNTLLFLAVVILSLLFVFCGINKYRKIQEKARQFQAVEKASFKQLRNFEQYSFQGIRVKVGPSPAMVLFNNTGLSTELNASLNTVASLEIYSNLKVNARPVLSMDIWDFSGIILFFGSIIAMALGFDIPRNKEYLKFLSSDWNPNLVFHSLLLTRFIFIVLALLLIFILGLVMLVIHNIPLSGTDVSALSGYAAASLVMLLFFLIIGAAVGSIRTKWAGNTTLVVVWTLLVFLLPGGVNSLFWESTEPFTQYYNTELDKIKVASDFEKRCYEKEGKFTREKLEIFKKLAENYVHKEYKSIIYLEMRLKADIQRNIHRYTKYSMFLPTTFYKAVSTEVSSMGYETYLCFYDAMIKMHGEYVRFWIDRVYYHDPTDMVSFIQGDDNLFQAASRLPVNFSLGLLINLCYIVLLYFVSYIRFKGILRKPQKADKPLKKQTHTLTIKQGQINSFYTLRTLFRDYLYLMFSGLAAHAAKFLKKQSPDMNIKINMDTLEIRGDSPYEGYTFLCHPRDIPGDIRGGDLLNYVSLSNGWPEKERKEAAAALTPELRIKTFDRMEEEEKVEVILTLIPYLNCKVLQLFHTCKYMPLEYVIKLKKQLEILSKRGTTIINFSTVKSVSDIGKDPGLDIMDLPYWEKEVESHENIS